MPQRTYEWLQRIKDVEREYVVVRLATDRLLAHVGKDPTLLDREMSHRDVRRASQRLDGTYIVRLFAEFETGRRMFWTAACATEPPGRTRDLLEGVAANRRIPYDTLDDAHRGREFRNHLVHERDEPVNPLTIPAARHNLCVYFSFLPLEWQVQVGHSTAIARTRG